MTGARAAMTPVALLPPDRFVGSALPGVLDAAPCDERIGVLARRGFAPTGEPIPGTTATAMSRPDDPSTAKRQGPV